MRLFIASQPMLTASVSYPQIPAYYNNIDTTFWGAALQFMSTSKISRSELSSIRRVKQGVMNNDSALCAIDNAILKEDSVSSPAFESGSWSIGVTSIKRSTQPPIYNIKEP